MNCFHTTEKSIFLTIKPLDPTKAHGCDNLSIRMVKICNESITISLKIMFE